MPRGTPLRNIRIPDDLWNRARATADARGETVSEVVRKALTKYIHKHGRTSA